MHPILMGSFSPVLLMACRVVDGGRPGDHCEAIRDSHCSNSNKR